MANVSVQVLADVRNATQNLGQITGQLDGLQAGLSKTTGFVKNMVTGFVALSAVKGAVALVGDSITAASDLQQSVGAVGSVFGDFAKTVTDKSKQAASAYGLSANQYNTSSALIGAVLKGQGVAMADLGGQTDALIGRATDLAATFGGTTADAVDALGAAFKGEFDTLEKYGISLKQSDINAELAARGQDKLTGAALKLATQQATSDLIMRQSADAQGQFGRESDSLAVKQQQLKAKFEDVKAVVGNALLPIMSNLAGVVMDRVIPAAQQMASWFGDNVVPKLKDLWSTLQNNVFPILQTVGGFITGTVVPALQSMAGFISNNSTVFGTLAVVLGTLYAGFVAYNTAMGIWSALTKGYAAVQAAFNVIMAINPFVLIIIGLTALVAGLIYAWKNSETFRNVVTGVWQAIQGVVSAVLNWFTGTLWPGIQNVYNGIKNGMGAVRDFFVSAWNAVTSFVSGIPGRITGFFSGIASFFSGIWSRVREGAVDGFNNVVSFVSGIPGRITGALGNLGGLLLGAGKSVIQGFLNGIENMFGNVKKTLSNLTSLLPDWKGPAKRDATILFGAGKLVIGGFVKGLESQYGNVRRSLTGLTNDVASTAFSGPSLAFAGTGSAGSGGVTVVQQFTVSPTADLASIGKETKKALDAWAQENGR